MSWDIAPLPLLASKLRVQEAIKPGETPKKLRSANRRTGEVLASRDHEVAVLESCDVLLLCSFSRYYLS